MKEKGESKDLINMSFEKFMTASTFKGITIAFKELCQAVDLKPTDYKTFYVNLKSRVNSWKAKSLWAKLDKRANRKEYKKPKPCYDTNVFIIGAGPCGLRTAIEAALLGCKVVVVEKRESFSRNNVLHLWPFLINDLKNLGAKKFFGRFCAGAIDHISIRQLQVILVKVSLLLGVQIHSNVAYLGLEEPPVDQSCEKIGWRAKVAPQDHPVSEYEFNVLIGADGRRNTINGFERKEFRGKLAIGITANLINRHSSEEARVEEISGVAFIFNQKFFKDLNHETGIDLENIVYYKDDTHYFVMTAKKQSLIKKGVIKKDYADVASLLSQSNISQEKLQGYASEAADFSTNRQLPHLDYALNHYGLSDVAMFDFTSLFQAVNAARIHERNGHHLLMGLVGDSLVEPFWPTGSGCARGFLGAFDAAWMIREWSIGKKTPLEVLAERESIYRLLPQTTPENLCKDYDQYGIDPKTRYPAINPKAVLPFETLQYFDTTNERLKQELKTMGPIEQPQLKPKTVPVIRSNKLLMWCQRVTDSYKNVNVENLTTSFKSGLALCAIIHRYRPHLIPFHSLSPNDVAKNNQLAFDIAENELGISPIMTGNEMATGREPDKLKMVAYIAQFYDTFKEEVPGTIAETDATTSPVMRTSKPRHSILARLSHRFKKSPKAKDREIEDKDEANKENKENKKIKSPGSSKKSKKVEQKDKYNGGAGLANNQVQLRNKQPPKDLKVDVSQNRVSGLRSQLTTQFEILAGVRREDGTPLNQQQQIQRPVRPVSEIVKSLNEASGTSKHFEPPPPAINNSDMCFFCGKRIYVMERMSVEGLFFHSSCFKCYYCGISLRVGSHNYTPDAENKHDGKFFCRLHVGKQYATRKRRIEDTTDASIPPPAIKICTPTTPQLPELTPQVATTPTPKDNLIAPLHKKYRATPERVELENMHANIKAGLVEVSEEQLALYNLGSSMIMDSEDFSSSDEYDAEIEYEYEGAVSRLSAMVAPITDDMDEDFEDDDEEFSEIDEEDEEYSDDDDEVYDEDEVVDEEEGSEESEYSDDEDSEYDEESDESDEEEEEEEEEEKPIEKRQSFSHQKSVIDLKQQWLMSQAVPTQPWRPPSLVNLAKTEEVKEVDETKEDVINDDISNEDQIDIELDNEMNNDVEEVIEEKAERWQDVMAAAIASYEDDLSGNRWHESVGRVKDAMAASEDQQEASDTETSSRTSTLNKTNDSTANTGKRKPKRTNFQSISALSEISLTISTPSSSIPSSPVSSVNLESMSYQEDTLGEYLKASPKSELDVISGSPLSTERLDMSLNMSQDVDNTLHENVLSEEMISLSPETPEQNVVSSLQELSETPEVEDKPVLLPKRPKSILSPRSILTRKSSATPPTVTKRTEQKIRPPSIIYGSFHDSLRDVPSIDDVEDEVLQNESIGMVLKDNNDVFEDVSHLEVPTLQAESLKTDTLRTRSKKKNTSGTTRAILDKRRDTPRSPRRTGGVRRSLPSSPSENSSPTITCNEKEKAKQLLLEKLEGTSTTPDVCPAGDVSSDYRDISELVTPKSPDLNLIRYENGIPSSESRSKEKRSRLSRMKLKNAKRKSTSNDRTTERVKKNRKGRKSMEYIGTSSENMSYVDEKPRSERAPIVSIDDDEVDPSMPDVVAGSTPKFGSKFHRPARRLTIDPKLNANIDDLAESSDDDDYSNQPVVVSDTKPKKSPRRMWGKKFKLKSFRKEKRKMEEEEISEQLTRRVQREARRQHKQQQQKRLRMAQEIQRQLQEVEVKNRELEDRGVEVEKALRGEGDITGMDEHTLMQQWFQLINEKHALVRFESELMIHKRELELEDRHSMLEQDLRQRMAVDDEEEDLNLTFEFVEIPNAGGQNSRKSSDDVAQEKLLLEEMLEVVEQRDALVALLEEERLREQQEDKDVEGIMLRKGFNLALREKARFSAAAAEFL
ncbi:protein-methionine sulfoxide oxidase mical3b-like isoform X3 [Antedon mediterranea]|uniref:protein-methionine sulfoxide oxidase mical3b-like isoform X3 n=1 Tax=Antedon mediterranea TaxID=105859 RepID=UPI003AF70EAF